MRTATSVVSAVSFSIEVCHGHRTVSRKRAYPHADTLTNHVTLTDNPAARHSASPFEKLYRDGVYRSLLKERCTSPMTDRYMLENVRASLRGTDMDGQHAYWLPTIGFHFGRLHGAILSIQSGSPRPDVTALASFQTKQTALGYRAGRGYYFTEARPDERIYTDAQLIERLQVIERESAFFHEEEDTWYYALGCILGEMSGPLFPATSEEYAHWKTPLVEYTV